MARVETGCRDCKNCTNSGLANFGRRAGRSSAKLMTLGMSEAVMATTKKCRACGHQMSLHGIADNVPPPSSVPTQVVIQGYAPPPPPAPVPNGPPAGWYQDPRGLASQRWWDGVQWTDHAQ